MVPPNPAPSNLYLCPGKLSPAALMADIREGIYVTELIGMGVNGVTGDYSRGAAGFMILLLSGCTIRVRFLSAMTMYPVFPILTLDRFARKFSPNRSILPINRPFMLPRLSNIGTVMMTAGCIGG